MATESGALCAAIDNASRALMAVCRRNLPQKNGRNYPYIPFDTGSFVEQLCRVRKWWDENRKDQDIRFLDVGCGVGTTLVLAKHYLDASMCAGIEYDERLINEHRCHVVHYVDALKFDDYSRYNVIYWYRPIEDNRRQKKLEQKIVADAKKGTLFVPVYRSFLPDESAWSDYPKRQQIKGPKPRWVQMNEGGCKYYVGHTKE